MHYTGFLVQVLQGIGNLSNDMSGEIFAEVGEADDLMEKLAARAKFKDNIVILSCLLKFDEFDNIRVLNLSHDLDFLQDVRSLWGL